MKLKIKKFRKKLVIVEAIQLTEKLALEMLKNKDLLLFGKLTCCGKYNLKDKKVYWASVEIKTLEGIMHAEIGDWIIKDAKGELYPCKPDIFKDTYTKKTNEIKHLTNLLNLYAKACRENNTLEMSNIEFEIISLFDL